MKSKGNSGKDKSGIRLKMIRRGLASAMLLTSLVAQASPVVQVFAETVTYDHGQVVQYKTSNGEYILEINPMAGVGNKDKVDPRAGKFVMKQTEQYDEAGRSTDVDGTEQAVNLKEGETNRFIVNSDGKYELRNTERIPGFYRDTKTYSYTLPLIEGGKEASEQVVNFQPKLAPVLGNVDFVKVDENNDPLAGVEFQLFQTYDATSGVKAPEGTTGNTGGGYVTGDYTDEDIPEYYTAITPADFKNDNSTMYYQGSVENILLTEDMVQFFRDNSGEITFGKGDSVENYTAVKGVAMSDGFRKALADTGTKLNMSEMFATPNMFPAVEPEYVEVLDLSYFDLTTATSMSQMFARTNIGEIKFGSYDTPNLLNMEYMFSGAKIGDLSFRGFTDVSKVNDVELMFRRATIENLDMGEYSVAKGTSFTSMFETATINNLNIKDMDINKTSSIKRMFYDAKIPNLDVSNLALTNVYGYMVDSYRYAFKGAQVGEVLDLSGADFTSRSVPEEMFTDSSIKKVYVKNEASAKKLESVTPDSENIEFIVKGEDTVPELSTEPIATLTTGTEGKVTFPELSEGKYYVQESKTVDGKAINVNKIEFEVTTDEDGTDLVVREIGDIDLKDDETHGKTFINYDQTTVDKTLRTEYTTKEGYEDTTQMVTTNGKVSYNINVDVPNDITTYSEYTITDKMSSKLNLDEETLSVIGHKWGGETLDLTKHAVVTTDESGADIIKLDIKDTPELKSDLTGLEKVVIRYDANVDTATVGTEETLSNNVSVEWDNGLGDMDVIEDVVEAIIKEGALEVVKQDGRDESVTLEGAEFQIYREGKGEGSMEYKGKTYVPVKNPRTREAYVGTTDAEGNVIFDSIPFGDYLLVETKAPEGYRLNNTHINFTIADTETQQIEGVEDSIRIEVDNYKQSDFLPATGTTGIVVSLLVGGALLVTGASLNKAKKKDEEEINE